MFSKGAQTIRSLFGWGHGLSCGVWGGEVCQGHEFVSLQACARQCLGGREQCIRGVPQEQRAQAICLRKDGTAGSKTWLMLLMLQDTNQVKSA